MNFLFWKKNKVVDNLAQAMADEFYSEIQPELANKRFSQQGAILSSAKKKSKGKEKKVQSKEDVQMDNALTIVIRKVQESRDIHGLGVYGKARLHMKFMQRLTDLGYSEEVSKHLNQIIMVKSP